MSPNLLANGYAGFFFSPIFLVGILFLVILIPTEALILRLMNWSSFPVAPGISCLANVASAAVGLGLMEIFNAEPGKPPGDIGFLRLWILALATVVVEAGVLMFANRMNLGLSFSAALAMNMASYLLLVWPLLTWLPDTPLKDTTIARYRQAQTMSELRCIGWAIDSYIVDHGHPPVPLPGDVEDIQSQLEPAYLKVLPIQDTWKSPIFYRTNGKDSYTIASAGKDRKSEDPLFRDVGKTTVYSCDIVYSNGQFVLAPEGFQH